MRILFSALLALVGCSKDDPAPGRDSTPSSSARATVELSAPPASSRALLARILTVHAEVPVTATVTLDDGASHQRTTRLPAEGAEFSVPFPGFRPDRAYTVTVELSTPDGTPVHTESLTVQSDPLPTLFPELDLRVGQPDPARGDTIFPVRTEAGAGYLLMVDGEGELIWVLDGGPTWWRTARLNEGGELMLIADHDVIVTDWGDLAPRAYPPPAGTEGYHHEAIPRPGGGFFAFTAGPLQVPDIPRSYDEACDPGLPATIWDSIVVEAGPDGEILNTWSLGERLDTHRIGWDSLVMTAVGPDWGHANGMQYLEEDDAFLISMRNQDLILKMSRATGQIEWILSNPWGWDPAFDGLRLQPTDPGFRWTFHQHAPEWLDGRMLVHDNGAENDMPCGPADQQPKRTRTVEFQIDEQARTVTQLWAYETDLFSPIMGDADRLPGGRVLTTYGQTDADETGVTHASRGRGNLAGRLIEFDPVTEAVSWDLEVYEADRPTNLGGFKVPRSFRVTDWWSP